MPRPQTGAAACVLSRLRAVATGAPGRHHSVRKTHTSHRLAGNSLGGHYQNARGSQAEGAGVWPVPRGCSRGPTRAHRCTFPETRSQSSTIRSWHSVAVALQNRSRYSRRPRARSSPTGPAGMAGAARAANRRIEVAVQLFFYVRWTSRRILCVYLFSKNFGIFSGGSGE